MSYLLLCSMYCTVLLSHLSLVLKTLFVPSFLMNINYAPRPTFISMNISDDVEILPQSTRTSAEEKLFRTKHQLSSSFFSLESRHLISSVQRVQMGLSARISNWQCKFIRATSWAAVRRSSSTRCAPPSLRPYDTLATINPLRYWIPQWMMSRLSVLTFSNTLWGPGMN